MFLELLPWGWHVLGVLWQLFVINLISTFDIVVAPVRISMTMGAVDTLPWWLVLAVASAGSSIGSLPLFFLARWHIHLPDKWKSSRLGRWSVVHRLRQRIAGHPLIVFILAGLRQHMFVWLVALNSVPFIDWFGTVLAGRERYPFWRFLAASIIGRCIHNLPLVIAGLLLAKYPWFHSWIALIRHPVTSFLLVLLLIVSIILVTRQLNKAQAQYNKAQVID